MSKFHAIFRQTIAIAGLAGIIPAASADGLRSDHPRASSDQAKWSLGLMLGSEQKAYRGMSNESMVLPLLGFENRWVRLQGPTLDIKLPDRGDFSFSLRGKLGHDGYEAGDASELTGMTDRKDGGWLGAAVSWQQPFGVLSAEWLTDASSHSSGNKFSLGAMKSWRFDKFSIAPRIGVTWLDAKYVDHYYGVAGSEANAGRAAYAGRSTTQTQIGVQLGYAIDPHQGLMLEVGTTALGSAIKDSPLVNRSSTSAVRAGYMYRF